VVLVYVVGPCNHHPLIKMFDKVGLRAGVSNQRYAPSSALLTQNVYVHAVGTYKLHLHLVE
jgi:hypothetical protein